jgi:hypothetical protein
MRVAMVARLTAALAAVLLMLPAQAAQDNVEIHAFVNDACIIADEPYFVPVTGNQDASDPMKAKFLPLLGVVIGKLAELFINHELAASANHIKSGAARKDTRYTMTKQMNLYRADLDPAPALGINAKLGCMTIVAANLKPETTDCRAQYLPKELSRETMGLPQDRWKTSRTDDSIENQLRRANICVDGKAHAVYEARFEFSADGTAYRLKDAGYRIESLLTTQAKGASRTALYTLKISNPSATEQQETLSSAWVSLGTVSAGARSSGSSNDSAPWLRVPPLSLEARRLYEDKTRVHQDVTGEIEALKRAITRNQRMVTALNQRIATTGGDVARGLRQERTRVNVQIQSQGAELEARNAEYQDLPRAPLELMPVSIEVAVTETESEKKAQLALADIVGKNSEVFASAVGTAATGLLSKSVDSADIKTEPDPAESATLLTRTRERYFDALVEVHANAEGSAAEDSKRNLAVAKQAYNDARRTLGLEQIK